MSRLRSIFLSNPMLCIFGVLALLSMTVIPPDTEYLDYFDWHTMGCLFCILAIANDVRSLGVFELLASVVVCRVKNMRVLCGFFIFLCGVMAAFITNDITLLIMLPLVATTLDSVGQFKLVPITFILITISANLCGMIMPFGNPHNLYLYNYFNVQIGEFLAVMALPFGASLIAILAAIFIFIKPVPLSVETECDTSKLDKAGVARAVILFAVALLGVFRIVPIIVPVLVVGGVLGLANSKAVADVDWSLLITFMCFFVFSSNMARIPELADPLSTITNASPLLATVIVSQFISNVPTSVLLSHFTDSWSGLIVGADIGGVGGPIGSLATVITMRTYSSFLKEKQAAGATDEQALPMRTYLKLLLGTNFVILAYLIVICWLSPLIW